MEFIKDMLGYLVVIFVVIMLKNYVVAPTEVVGASMSPTLENKDLVLLDKITYKFKDVERFDIIVLNYDNTRYLIKRVIGLPGDYIEYIDNKLYVNDEEMEEAFINMNITEDFSLTQFGFEEIPENKYLVLGDNRSNSTDSRAIGLIDKDSILGKTFFIIWPFNKFSLIN